MVNEEEVLRALRRIGVWSHRKRRELASILLHHDPPHLKRLYLGGFLLYGLNMSVEEVADFIERYCAWRDFDRRITERNLRGIHKCKGINGPKKVSSGPKIARSNGPTSDEPLEKIGTEVWVGHCCANGYPLMWSREYLLG